MKSTYFLIITELFNKTPDKGIILKVYKASYRKKGKLKGGAEQEGEEKNEKVKR